MAAYLSDEILMEVLKRLSVKSLLRMRCVQKSWYYLIQTPYFKSLHYDYQKDKNNYLLFSSPHINRYSLRFDDKQCKEYCALRFPDDVMENSNSWITIYGVIYIYVLEKEGEVNEAWTEMVTLYPYDFVGRWCPVGFRNDGEIVLTNPDECGYLSYDLEEATEFVEDSADIWHFEDNFESTYFHEDGMLDPFDPMYVCPFEENLVLLDENLNPETRTMRMYWLLLCLHNNDHMHALRDIYPTTFVSKY